jgi:hypothetical protein
LVHTAWALHVCGQDVRGLLEVAGPLLRAEGRVQQLKELDLATLLWLLAGTVRACMAYAVSDCRVLAA